MRANTMRRERALKVMTVLAGLLFVAGICPVATILWQGDWSQHGDAMMLSLHVTLGVLPPIVNWSYRVFRNAMSAFLSSAESSSPKGWPFTAYVLAP